MSYLGNYIEDYADLNFKFTTRRFSTGAPYALSGGTISVYKSNDTTQSTAGVTLTADFDSVTGLNNVKIDLSADAFYAVGKDYQVVITAGTVDSVSVVGECIASFSIENRFQEVDVVKWLGTAAATPTVAGVPEVDVTHWLGTAAATPTTAGVPEVDITHIAGSAVNTSSAQLGVNVVNAAGTAWGSGAITAASIAADAITAAKIADGAIDAATFAAGAITAAAIATNAIDADAIAADAVTEIQAGLATPTNITAGTITTVTNLTNAPTNGDLTATMKTSVNTEALNALVTHRLDELLNADSDIDGAAPPTVGSVFHELMTKTAGSFTFDQTTDSLEAIKDAGGGGLTAQEVRDAMKLAPTAGAPAAGSVDEHLDDILTDTAEIGVAGAGLTNINLPNQTMDIVGNITGNLSGSVGSVSGAVGSVTGSVGSVASGGITATSIAADAITDSEISAAGCNKIADHVLRRTQANVEASSNGDTYSGRSLAGATAKLVNKVGISGSTLTVYKSDDAATSFTQAVTTDAAADPITVLDTA